MAIAPGCRSVGRAQEAAPSCACRFGNTSSSTTWYALGFVESFQGVAKGDRVWQVGLGAGFKCDSAVWRALRPVREVHGAWERVIGREGEALEHLLSLAREKVRALHNFTMKVPAPREAAMWPLAVGCTA